MEGNVHPDTEWKVTVEDGGKKKFFSVKGTVGLTYTYTCSIKQRTGNF